MNQAIPPGAAFDPQVVVEKINELFVRVHMIEKQISGKTLEDSFQSGLEGKK